MAPHDGHAVVINQEVEMRSVILVAAVLAGVLCVGTEAQAFGKRSRGKTCTQVSGGCSPCVSAPVCTTGCGQPVVSQPGPVVGVIQTLARPFCNGPTCTAQPGTVIIENGRPIILQAGK